MEADKDVLSLIFSAPKSWHSQELTLKVIFARNFSLFIKEVIMLSKISYLFMLQLLC